MENNLTRKVGENYVSNDSLHSGIPLNRREKIILCETFLMFFYSMCVRISLIKTIWTKIKKCNPPFILLFPA